MSVLVVMSGLPGAGKSAVARGIATTLQLPLLEMDTVFAPIFERVDGDVLEWAPYEAFTAFADVNLRSGVGAILDSVCWTQRWRDEWSALATKHATVYRPIEVVCPDEDVHRERLRTRAGKPVGLIESWEQMIAARDRFWEPWTTDRLVLDSTQPLEALIDRAVAYVSA